MIRLTGATRLDGPRRRRSPVRFFHVVYFVMGGGVAVLWSPVGLLAIAVAAVVGYVLLKARASTLDLNHAQLGLSQLRDDLVQLRNAAEHPDGSAEERLQTLELLHRYGGISSADYDAGRARIVGEAPRDGSANEHPDVE